MEGGRAEREMEAGREVEDEEKRKRREEGGGRKRVSVRGEESNGFLFSFMLQVITF